MILRGFGFFMLAFTPMRPAPTSALVLGAGLGTRLKELTRHLPKPLLPVCNEPLIARAFSHLQGAGVTRFVVNTHWQAHAYQAAFPSAEWAGCPLFFSHESPEVLETAGGMKQAETLLAPHGPFWVYNGDILADFPLERAWAVHCAAQNEVTLVLRSKNGPLQVSFAAGSGRIVDLGRRLQPELAPEFLFTGVYLVEPEFLRRIPAGVKLGVVPVFLDMIREGARLGGVVIDDGGWWDLGTREQIFAVHQALAQRGGSPWIAADAEVDSDVEILGATAIGGGVRIGGGSRLEDCVVWPGAVVQPNSQLRRCIVTGNALVSGAHIDADL